jgi:hypothetical protein
VLKLLLEVEKESTGLWSGRASRDGGHHGDAPHSITTRCLFSLDTGHGTFSFSAAKKLRHQMAVDWKNQCALTSTRMLLTF